MATYFNFEKKRPHINYDDVYVKYGEVKDDKLVLEYSIEEIDPLSISLSAFDKHIESYDSDENSLSLLFNAGKGCIAIDKKDLGKNVSDVRIEDGTLWLDYNDGSDSISAKLPDIPDVPDMYLSSGKIEDKQLVLEYEDNTKNVSVDISQLIKDDQYVNDIELCADNKLHFKYKLAEVEDKFVDLSKFDKYIVTAEVKDGVLSASYNDNSKAFNIPLDNINYELSSGTIDNYLLSLQFTNGKDAVVIDAHNLISNDYVENGRYDEKTEKLILNYNTQTLPELSIDIPRRCEDYKNALSSMSFNASDEKSILSIAQAIEQIVTAFGGNK